MTRYLVVSCVLAALGSTACGSSDDQNDSTAPGTGGAAGFGGTAGTSSASGGAATSQSGGATSAASGGALATGGTAISAGGSTPASGGSFGMGGTGPIMGGAPGSGGLSTGGASGSAGMRATGGTGGIGGAGGAGGSAGNAGATSGDDPCAGGTMGPASDASGSKIRVSGYGNVYFTASTKTQITSLETTLAVPAKPPAGGTLFLWPGLEPLPGGANYDPIGTGVLQPVLTWGGTCAPNAPNNYADWWISAQYVNTLGSAQGFTGCKGGQGMTVSVGDQLHILMAVDGTTWKQSVTDMMTNKTVTFDFDLKAQAQDWVIFSIEAPTGKQPVSDVVFTSTVITTADSSSSICTASQRGTNDYVSATRTSSDGRHCCVPKIILRGQGVPPSGPNN